jgi:hypothetical protein
MCSKEGHKISRCWWLLVVRMELEEGVTGKAACHVGQDSVKCLFLMKANSRSRQQ